MLLRIGIPSIGLYESHVRRNVMVVSQNVGKVC